MESTDYTGVEWRSSLIKNEDVEEGIEEKNRYGMRREEELLLSNIKEEEEEGGEMKREDCVKEEEEEIISKFNQTDRWLKKDGTLDCRKQDEDGSKSLVTSCLLKQPRVASPGAPVFSSSKGECEAFACSQCTFVHMEEVKLHQHIEKVHPEEHSRILRSGGNRAEDPLPPSSTHQHPTPRKTLPTPTQSHTGTPGAHTCSLCGKSFRRKSNLTVHQRIHTGECPYQCSQCGKSFSQSSSLASHQRTHTGECPYRCTQCGRSFNQPNNLTVHERIHTGKRPYHCSQCDKTFTQWCSLKVHQKTHTGELPYHCSHCGKSFRTSGNLKSHQQVHTRDCLFHCFQCGKGFKESSALIVHQQNCTGDYSPLSSERRKSSFQSYC